MPDADAYENARIIRVRAIPASVCTAVTDEPETELSLEGGLRLPARSGVLSVAVSSSTMFSAVPMVSTEGSWPVLGNSEEEEDGDSVNVDSECWAIRRARVNSVIWVAARQTMTTTARSEKYVMNAGRLKRWMRSSSECVGSGTIPK